MARKGKVTVVGAGFYGSTTAQRLAEYDVFETVVLTDIIEGKPEGLALDGRGGLLVVETGRRRLARIDLASRAVTTVAGDLAMGRMGAEPTTPPHLTLNGVAVAPSGTIFVSGDDVVYRIE